ncbi:23S rRNA pseudouridine2605 synthase [Bacilli bacterium PM5-3]|nr:23S rRNA pseudouridine2605 synthase [Bacilli bacterium PM5-3]MDH6603881.1 23S rRNA pseudouridine2605 synthase [Bacilli bacterium PM5-9]
MERLQKVIAQSGICSRRKAEQLIVDGKVKVNGDVVCELGTKVIDSDIIIVDNKKIKREKKEYYLLFKPKSIISSTTDEHSRETVVDIIETDARIYPVGRLDYDTTGLIILTNDGEFANKMMHPSSKVKKGYIAFVDGLIGAEQIKKLEQGVLIDNKMTKKAKAKILHKDFKQEKSKVRLIISEGKNHQVKRMFEAVGLKVRKLHRETYGSLNLNGLVPGEYRKLKRSEVEDLLTLAKGDLLEYKPK